MTMLRVWHALVYLGDGAVLIPCAGLLFIWLIAAPMTRRSGWWWLLAMLLVSAGVALSKILYMVTGWSPSGWNFTGLSGHAALSFLFWPSVGALVTTRNRMGTRVAAIGMCAGIALAISAASWVLGAHSLSEVLVGALWGAAVAMAFLLFTWRQGAEAPFAHHWMIASMLLLALFAFGHEFPSRRVLSWIALLAGGHPTLHTRADLDPQALLPKKPVDGRQTSSPAARTPARPQETP